MTETKMHSFLRHGVVCWSSSGSTVQEQNWKKDLSERDAWI